MKILLKILEWLAKRWRARQRSIDMKILWPLCKEHCEDLDLAKAAFMQHAMYDEAWTADHTEAELIAFVDRLK